MFAPHLTLRPDGLASSGLKSNSLAGVTTWTLTTIQNDVKLVIDLRVLLIDSPRDEIENTFPSSAIPRPPSSIH